MIAVADVRAVGQHPVRGFQDLIAQGAEGTRVVALGDLNPVHLLGLEHERGRDFGVEGYRHDVFPFLAKTAGQSVWMQTTDRWRPLLRLRLALRRSAGCRPGDGEHGDISAMTP